MTTLQKTVIAIVAAGAVAVGVYQAFQVTKLRQQVQSLEQQRQADQVTLSNQLQALQQQRNHASNALAALDTDNAKKNPNEVLKLRGDVGRLRQENSQMGSRSGLSKVTASPEARKMLRDQQKTAMSAVYKNFAKNANLTSQQTEQFNDLLADNIMENVEHVTTVLREKPTAEEMTRLFASQEAELEAKLQSLLGPDSVTQYKDYTKNLLSGLTAEQFRGMLSGDDAAKQAKVDQLRQMMQEEVQTALAKAGLPPDYQTVPMLNFRNIASPDDGDRSLKLLDDIYQQVTARITFLSPEELTKFQEFKTAAINNNRMALTLNRTLMAPISQ